MRLLAALSLVCACACVTERIDSRGDASRPSAAVQRRSARVVEPCVVSGCSGQVCASQPLFSSCEWRPEYACFANATCAPQVGGGCGWTMTDALRSCLGAAANDGR